MPTTERVAHPLLTAARAILPDVVEIRRRLHRIPELGLDAVRDLGADVRAAPSRWRFSLRLMLDPGQSAVSRDLDVYGRHHTNLMPPTGIYPPLFRRR